MSQLSSSGIAGDSRCGRAGQRAKQGLRAGPAQQLAITGDHIRGGLSVTGSTGNVSQAATATAARPGQAGHAVTPLAALALGSTGRGG